MLTHIRKIGNSSGAIIPAELLRRAGLKEGDTIIIDEVDNNLLIKKDCRSPNYSLDELLARCDSSAEMPDYVESWDADQSQGSELL